MRALAAWTLLAFLAVQPIPVPRTALARAPMRPLLPREGEIVVTSFELNRSAVLFSPRGKEIRTIAVGAAAAPIHPGEQPVCSLMRGRLSPDGKRLAALKIGPIPQGNVGPWVPMHVWLFEVESKEGPKEPLIQDVRNPCFAWSADGTKLYGSQVDPKYAGDPHKAGEPPRMVSWVYDLKSKKKASLALPPEHAIVDVATDGKALLTVAKDPWDLSSVRTYIVTLNTLKPRPLTATAFEGMRFSPDGKRVIGCQHGKKEDKASPALLSVVAMADGSERSIPVRANAVEVRLACWSPDGKRIAYEWLEKVASPPNPAGRVPSKLRSRVTVADVDGSNAKTILRDEYDHTMQGFDWK